MNLHAKMTMPIYNSTLKHYSDKKCGRYNRFSDSKIVYFLELFQFFASHVCIQNWKKKIREKNLIHTNWSDKAFKGSVVTLALPFLHGGSHVIH